MHEHCMFIAYLVIEIGVRCHIAWFLCCFGSFSTLYNGLPMVAWTEGHYMMRLREIVNRLTYWTQGAGTSWVAYLLNTRCRYLVGGSPIEHKVQAPLGWLAYWTQGTCRYLMGGLPTKHKVQVPRGWSKSWGAIIDTRACVFWLDMTTSPWWRKKLVVYY